MIYPMKKKYYRSIGGNQNNLNTTNETVEIYDDKAMFSGPLSDNIGVGDVLQYQTDSQYYSAFIAGRLSSTFFTVYSCNNNLPQPCDDGTAVEIYRVYNSLSDWESQTTSNVNQIIDSSVRDKVLLPGTNLLSLNIIAIVACYADSPDNLPVIIDGWITGVDNYIKIYTPVSPDHVGQSQRHNGVWNTSK